MQAVVYRKLSELVEQFKTDRKGPREKWVKRLFSSLDWGDEDRSTFSIVPDPGHGFQLVVDKFPVVNILTSSPSKIERVYSALNRAYNQDVAWVVATDFHSLGVYGSYWYSFRHDISSARALEMDASEYLLEAHRLEILTPNQVASNKLADFYNVYTGRKQRLPIDAHLVKRMSNWRQLALDALGEKASVSDPLIYRLINTLFLIRYIEDTSALQLNATLLNIAQMPEDGTFLDTLRTVFAQVSQHTKYNVPTFENLQYLRPTPLRTLINQLYGYQEWGVEYDFSAMNVDVLGRFYEEYLQYEIVPRKRLPALSLFEPPSYEYEDVKKKQGIYYTPRYIVNHILSNLVDRYKANDTSKSLPVILDAAAGSGTFLTAAVDALIEAYPTAQKAPMQMLDRIIGLDSDERAIEAARLNLTAKFLALGTTELTSQIKLKQYDLLLSGPRSRALSEVLPEGGVDIVVGNPPYIQYEALKKDYDLSHVKGNFETAGDRFDSYIFFIEAAIRLLKDGGVGGLVLPNTFLRAKTASSLREWLSQRADILEFVDFLDQPVFKGVGAYVCLLLFRKRSQVSETPKVKVLVAKIHQLSETPASQLARISVADQDPTQGYEVFKTDQPSGGATWSFQNDKDIELTQLIAQASDVSVRDIIDVRQGIKTGADGVFVVKALPYNADLYTLVDDSTFKIEKDLLIPIFRNRNLRRWIAYPTEFLLYTYDQSTHRLIEWSRLEKLYPEAAHYLAANKGNLEQRQSLRGKEWYELIEPRHQTLLANAHRLFIAELSLRPTICRSSNSSSAILGSTGGGSWLIPKNNDYDIDVLMAYLNSTVAEWFLRQISSLRRGGYILLEQQIVARLPIPNFLNNSELFVWSEIKRLTSHIVHSIEQEAGNYNVQLLREIEATEEQINSHIIQAFGFTASQARYIQDRIVLSRGAYQRK